MGFEPREGPSPPFTLCHSFCSSGGRCRERSISAESRGREGCLDRIRPPSTKALPPPHLGFCSSRWLGFPVHSPPAQNQLVSSWGTQPWSSPSTRPTLPQNVSLPHRALRARLGPPSNSWKHQVHPHSLPSQLLCKDSARP